MRNLIYILAVSALAIVGCSNNSAPCTPGAIEVSAGATPVFRTTSCINAQSLEVRELTTFTTVWGIYRLGDRTLPGKVTYGRVPAGAAEDTPAAALVPGRQYVVTASEYCCGEIISATERAVFVVAP